jgi:hypothetical protein
VTATASAAVTVTDAAPVWPWPVEAARYDRRPELTANEREALDRLGMDVRRRRGYDRDAPEWRTVERLLRPLDDARAALWCPDSRYYRRAITDAIGLVLLRCGEDNTAFWGWSDADWSRLIGTSATEFERPWPGWIDGTIRPYITAYAYLLTGFTAFDRIGNFDKRPVAWRVFGRETVDGCIDRISDVLGTWGYRTRGAHDDRLRPVICMALLLNRSPLLEDLTTEAFERLRTHPQMSDWHVGALFGIQRAVATLGHCEPPSMSMHGSMPDIESGGWQRKTTPGAAELRRGGAGPRPMADRQAHGALARGRHVKNTSRSASAIGRGSRIGWRTEATRRTGRCRLAFPMNG